jgi:hypothetical protein
VSAETGSVTKRAAKKAPAQVPDEDARLLAEQAEEEEAAAQREAAAVFADAVAPEPEDGEKESSGDGPSAGPGLGPLGLPDDLAADLPPAVMAILAAQAAQTAATQAAMTKVMETLAERVAGHNGSEITLSGSAEQLLRQLNGTVSDGGDGDDPLDEAVVFIHRGREGKVIKKSRQRITMPDGTQAFTTGVTADFAPNGMFSTRNREMVAYLKSRPGWMVEYWALGAEPHAAIDPSETLKAIFRLSMSLDDKGLAELEVEERATHKRPGVLQALAAARSQVQAFEGAEA